MRVWMIRHAEGLARCFPEASQTVPDAIMPITEFGMEQAEKTGAALAGFNPPARMDVSPATRTRQTAEGLRKSLRMADSREETALREHDPARESPDKLSQRVRDYIATLEHDGTDRICVGHGVPLQEMERQLTGQAHEKRGNAEAVLLEGDKAGSFFITEVISSQVRLPNLPPGFKMAPIGGWQALEKACGFKKPEIITR